MRATSLKSPGLPERERFTPVWEASWVTEARISRHSRTKCARWSPRWAMCENSDRNDHKKRPGRNPGLSKNSTKKPYLGLLRLAAHKGRNIQIVGGNFAAHFATYVSHIFIYLMNHVGQLLLHGLRRWLRHFGRAVPGFGDRRWARLHVFLVGFLEARGDHRDL